MKKLLFILLLISSNSWATTVQIPTTYATNGQVTNTNLNGNFTALANKINGGIDNDNVDTTNGYRLFKTVAALPSAGTQGAVYFLTADNTLNFDTGSTFSKSLSLTSPTTGDIPYYNSGWSSLAAGTLNLPLVSNGPAALPTYKLLPAVGGGTNANLSAATVGAVPYFSATGTMAALSAGTSGQVVVSQGAGAPVFANALSSVSDYGTSASSSTARQATAVKVAFGSAISVAGGGSQAVTNLPFSSSSTYTAICSAKSSFGTPPAGTDQNSGNLVCSMDSGAQFTIYNTDDQTKTVNWMAIGI